MTVQNNSGADIRPIAKILLAHPASARATLVLRDGYEDGIRAVEVLIHGYAVARAFQKNGEWFRAGRSDGQWTSACNDKLVRRGLRLAQSRSLRGLSTMGVRTYSTALEAMGGEEMVDWSIADFFSEAA